MKITIISPHLDDAAFSLSLTIAKWIRCGHEIRIVNCFTRSCYAPKLNPADLEPGKVESCVTALRRQEDEAWSSKIGVAKSRIDLNLQDAPLRLRCSTDDVCAISVEADGRATQAIQSYLKNLDADVFVVPMAIGAHVDHLTARDASLSLELLEVPCAFYEDLPYAARPGAADGIEDLAAQIDLDLKPIFIEEPLHDVIAAINHKKELSLQYQSQIVNTEADVIARFCIRYCGRERLWANAAWRTCPLLQEDESC